MMEQRTPEWYAARAGRLTASRVADIMARTKTGYSASRANYRAQLVCERLTGTVSDSYVNSAMQHGIDTEPQARAAYEFFQDCEVEEVGFVAHPSLPMAGCSPDGFVGGDGLVEIKCPQPAAHIETLLSGEIDGKYLKQMAFQIACTGRVYCDFVSYQPSLPAEMQIFVKRVNRDDALISEIENEARSFLGEVDDVIGRLTQKFSIVREAA